MAKTIITTKLDGVVRSILEKDSSQVSIKDTYSTTTITKNDHNTKSIKNKDFAISKIKDTRFSSLPKEVLPFRVKFINIGIEGYGPNNPAPIGIAVIGVNNYIL
jgi:hypothetical protein